MLGRDIKFINSIGVLGSGPQTKASDLSKIMGYAMSYPELRKIVSTAEKEIVTKRAKTRQSWISCSKTLERFT
jgi:D-alanyl-D-alanine carboxypeptidase